MSTDQYAVFGDPINHSKSPRIHSLFASQTKQALTYTAQQVSAEMFSTATRRFFAEGGKGLNCTVPLKELAWEFAEQLSERAQLAKAVNTLKLTAGGQIYGDNTDGIGLLNDLRHNGIELTNARVLVLGAGGATRGILSPLLAANPRCMVIANRTLAKAEKLAEEFTVTTLTAIDFNSLAGQTFDLIINATSASLSGNLPPLPPNILAPNGCCYDLAYANQATSFVTWGQAQGAAKSLDGLGMLVEQAAEAFFLWRGIRPDTTAVIKLLNSERNLA